VDDGSTDRTAAIVDSYEKQYPWIELIRRPRRPDRSFAGKVYAFNLGFDRVASLTFEVLGNLDADLSFDRDYLAFLMQKFFDDPKLGVIGTPFTENGATTQRGIASEARITLLGMSTFSAAVFRGDRRLCPQWGRRH